MRLLAIETATEACSAALLVEGEVRERYRIAPREHAALILPMVRELLDEAGLRLAALDGIGFGRGPGAFTGVRIATGVVQGLAFASDLPVVPVSTLAALAHGQGRENGAERVAAALDARMGEVYWGCYRVAEGEARLVGAREQVCAAEAVDVPSEEPWVGAGPGWARYAETLASRFGSRLAATRPERLPRAADVARLAAAGLARGEAVAAEDALPVYLRDRVVNL